MDKKTFRILAIDGGGIRGLLAASILKRFETRFKVRLTDHFDLICGTSTGGIIAAGLAAGKSAEEITDYYFKIGPKIFFKKNKLSNLFKKYFLQIFIKSKYGNLVLKNELVSFLSNNRFKDSSVYLCLPSFDINSGIPYIFKTDHDPTLSRDSEIFLWEAALATTAAPTYFPIYMTNNIKGKKFVDGGIWANNPSLVGIVEYLKYFKKEYNDFIVISISNGTKSINKEKLSEWRNSLIGWKVDLLNLFFSSQVRANDFMLKHVTDGLKGRYLRIEPQNVSSVTKIFDIDLDETNNKILESMIGLGESIADMYASDEIIKEIFSEQKCMHPIFYYHNNS